ncbi:unnamed protein product [Pieris macdunnoughi]|uniref:BESS domain-containing protein n=1 Tax=Pieris macdunnoughi TaxID=345717 RepID=A0A821X3H4_9NEOP|nr:unnamed protein product [Pieris macdunnoughi]
MGSNILFQTPNIAPNTQEASVSESNDEEFTVPRTTSRNKRKLKDPLLRAVDALEKVSSQHFSNNSGDDEFDLFGRTIAQQLRQLPLEAALETEEVILATIRQQRIKLLKQTSLSLRGTSSSMSDCMKSNRTITITIPENQQVAQSSSESESIAATSTATNNDAEDEYYTYNEDILSQAVASVSGSHLDRELNFDNY